MEPLGKVLYPNLFSCITNQTTERPTYILLALLPVAKFMYRNKWIYRVLTDHLLHECINLIVKPLKQAACLDIIMSDPQEFNKYCFTPLVAAAAAHMITS